jgi:hypothetical protein
MHLPFTGLLEHPVLQALDLSYTRPKHPRLTLLNGHHQLIFAHINPDTEMKVVHCQTPLYIMVEDASAYLVHAALPESEGPRYCSALCDPVTGREN